MKLKLDINPFDVNSLLLYTLKTSENVSFSDVFRSYGKGRVTSNGLARLPIM